MQMGPMSVPAEMQYSYPVQYQNSPFDNNAEMINVSAESGLFSASPCSQSELPQQLPLPPPAEMFDPQPVNQGLPMAAPPPATTWSEETWGYQVPPTMAQNPHPQQYYPNVDYNQTNMWTHPSQQPSPSNQSQFTEWVHHVPSQYANQRPSVRQINP